MTLKEHILLTNYYLVPINYGQIENHRDGQTCMGTCYLPRVTLYRLKYKMTPIQGRNRRSNFADCTKPRLCVPLGPRNITTVN